VYVDDEGFPVVPVAVVDQMLFDRLEVGLGERRTTTIEVVGVGVVVRPTPVGGRNLSVTVVETPNHQAVFVGAVVFGEDRFQSEVHAE
jgi:hypothetical protein